MPLPIMIINAPQTFSVLTWSAWIGLSKGQLEGGYTHITTHTAMSMITPAPVFLRRLKRGQCTDLLTVNLRLLLQVLGLNTHKQRDSLLIFTFRVRVKKVTQSVWPLKRRISRKVLYRGWKTAVYLTGRLGSKERKKQTVEQI